MENPGIGRVLLLVYVSCCHCWVDCQVVHSVLDVGVIVSLFIFMLVRHFLVLVLAYVIVCADISWWILVMCVWICFVICSYWNPFLVDQSSSSAFLKFRFDGCMSFCLGDCLLEELYWLAASKCS